ncbi:MAG: trigger factor [Steroidobacteraceae bacterium]|nr:trigger factor [Steroidobacteraceae bacterium]
MQVSLTATSGLERRLEVAVPAQRVSTEVEQRLKKISRTARLKGFRPGKAPFSVIQRQYGEQVHGEVVGDLIRSTFAEAVSQEKLNPAAGPRIEPIAISPGSDLKYAATFEVMPEIHVQPVDSIAIERPTCEVTEADVDAMIESMRRQRPDFVVVERAAQDTDRVTVDYSTTVDGKPVKDGEGKDISFIIGSNRVMTELEQGVKGAAAGETRTVQVAFPAEHPNKELAGKTAEFRLDVKKVEEQRLPEVDEAFCKAFGVTEGGVEALRAEVRQSMTREMQDLIRNRLRTQVFDALYRDNKFEVPRALVQEQVQQLQLDMARRANITDPKQLPPPQTFEEPARRRVALGLLLSEIVRAENIKVDRERVQARLADLTAAYPNPDEVRRAYLQNADAMRQIESAVLEDQVVDWVVERAKVTDRPVSFTELTGFGANAATAGSAGA